MALATRCPNCQSTFRVVADQLKLRGGLVRCGNCRYVFDAISSLSYVDDQSIAAASDPPTTLLADAQSEEALAQSTGGKPNGSSTMGGPLTDSPLAQVGEIVDRVVDPEATVLLDAAAVESFRSPMPPPAALADNPQLTPLSLRTRPAGKEIRDADPPLTFDPARPEPWASAQTPGTTPKAATSATAASKAVESSAAGNGDISGRASTNRLAVSQPNTAIASDDDPPKSPKPRRRRGTVRPSPEEQSLDDTPSPTFLNVSSNPRRSVFFSIGTVALGVLLLVQLAVGLRSDLVSRWPASRPALIGLCSIFSCSVGWPMRADLLAVVASELQQVPGTDALELNTVLRSRAPFNLALPAIEVTLTDTQNRTIARKVFTPADYLTGSGEASRRINEGLPGGSDYPIRLLFEARGVAVVGFNVYPFYL